MDVRYDARTEATMQATGQATPLEEEMRAYPELSHALQACCLRFVVSLPEENLRNAPRLCFELQEAYWFYLDYLWEEKKKDLPKLTQLHFVTHMLEFSDILCSLYSSPKARRQLFTEWGEYVRKVPLKGAILLTEKLNKCLMIQPWKGEKWTFPRGKINEDESECECAVREVWEETGIDVKGMVDAGEYVKADVHGTGFPIKLFLVPGVPEDTPCAPNTRKEVSKIGWINVTKLPGWSGGPEDAKLKFVGVEPFIHDLRRWVEEQKSRGLDAPGRRRFPGTTPARPVAEEAPAPESRPSGGRRRGKGGAAAPAKESGGAKEKEAEAAADDFEAPFVLDLARVMLEFDKGWQKAGERTGKRPARPRDS